MNDARALEKAGAFALVLECMPPGTARKITATVKIPTIGIGAGPYCDGQILVTHDMLGLSGRVSPKFVKQYVDFTAQMKEAIGNYKTEVDDKKFPSKEHCY
jgi:3-methyl-2-oxobutanoate hydroxymethyltransferase